MKKQKIQNLLNQKGIDTSDFLINYIDRLQLWGLEEYLENLIRNKIGLPSEIYLDGGEDWEVSTEIYFKNNKRVGTVDFYFRVFGANDTYIPYKTFLEILQSKYNEEQTQLLKNDLAYSQNYKGEHVNGLKQGAWSYIDNKTLISEGKYNNGKRIGEWKIYYNYHNIKITETRIYLENEFEIPFYNSFYSTGNPKYHTELKTDGSIETMHLNESGEILMKYQHKSNGQFIKTTKI